MAKTCRVCKEDKGENEYEKIRNTCKKCRNKQRRAKALIRERLHADENRIECREWHAKNKDKVRIRNREWQKKNFEKIKHNSLKSNHGISLDEYKEMLESQGNVCAICFQPETKIIKATGKTKSLCVDHDHKTGKIRGLLCDDCNVGIGKLKDNKDNLKNAALYLERHSNNGEQNARSKFCKF